MAVIGRRQACIYKLYKVSEDACIKLNNPNELSLAFRKLLDNDLFRKDMIDKALKVINQNKGSTKKQFEYIKNILK